MKTTPMPAQAQPLSVRRIAAHHKRLSTTRDLYCFLRDLTVGFRLVELFLLAAAAIGLAAYALAEELRYRAQRRLARLDGAAADRFADRCMVFSGASVVLFLIYHVLLAINSGAFDRAVR